MSAGVVRASVVPVRGTQSFVGTLTECWRRPGWTGIEVLWRWALGIPALLVVGSAVRRVLLDATEGTFSLARLGLDAAVVNDPVGQLTADPMGTVGKIQVALRTVGPGLERVAVWGVPVLLALGVVLGGLGRTALLKRVDASLHRRAGTVMGLQALRMAGLAGTVALWFWAMHGVERFAIAEPMAMGQEPGLVLYCAMTIVLTMGMFVGWGLVSWWFGVAPLLAMLEDRGVVGSLRAAGRLRGLRSKLVEINLVMGIVKIALIVLLMVFSACPLPFESVESQTFLFWWCAGVLVLYFVVSDFFHVTRLVSYLRLWRVMEEK